MEVNGYKIEPYANLDNANLTGANLYKASLYKASLSFANLTGADLLDLPTWIWNMKLLLCDLYFKLEQEQAAAQSQGNEAEENVYDEYLLRQGYYYGDIHGGYKGEVNRRYISEEYEGFYNDEFWKSYDDGYEDYYDDCYGDCNDMDNDGRTWDDYDRDGDGLYESP